MKLVNPFLLAAFLVIAGGSTLLAQDKTADAPGDSTDSSKSIEQEKLDIEKLKLDNERLKLEIEKMKLQGKPVASSPNDAKTKGDSKEALLAYQADFSKKTEDLAKEKKDEENILVLDLVNSEVWNKGVRYSIHDFYNLAEDRGWKMTKKLDERGSSGNGRYLYQNRNVSFLKYENHDRGIIALQAPGSPDGLEFVTPDGISFQSSSGDVRNAYENIFFHYEAQDEVGNFKVLKYKHGRGLSFDDKLEFYFDREGKLVKLRYGVLDEH
jgi:hypothetical protein